MKVILTQDIVKVGKKYEVKNVADGYALNALIPQGKAMLASTSALKRVEKVKAEEDAKRAALESLIAAEVGKVNGSEITIIRPVNEQGHLFASVHEADIAAAILETYQASFEPRHIIIDAPIKTVGSHKVHLHVGSKKGVLTVTIASSAEITDHKKETKKKKAK